MTRRLAPKDLGGRLWANLAVTVVRHLVSKLCSGADCMLSGRIIITSHDARVAVRPGDSTPDHANLFNVSVTPFPIPVPYCNLYVPWIP